MISNKIAVDWLNSNPKILKGCNEVNIATALTSEWALDLLIRNIPEKARVRLLLGIHIPSSMKVLEKLLDFHKKNRLECRLYAKNFFHPKLYLLNTENSCLTFIGSGNFTQGGLLKNIELFHKSNSQDEYDKYKQWFDKHFEVAKPISEEHLILLKPYLEKIKQREQEDTEDINIISDIIEGNFNIDAVDFSDQFFQKEHHETFSPKNKRKENDPVVDEMRKQTRNRLYDLHDELLPEIANKGWNLYPHYMTDDIVAKTELIFHSSHEIGALWIHYGRDKKEIKSYGDNETPLFFSRLQVILHYNNVGIWLRFGKAGGSRQDREYFRENMTKTGFRLRCYNLIQNLGNEYWINIGNDSKRISEFKNENEFWEFTLSDDWKTDYFIIGMSMNLGDTRTKENNIVATVIEEFTKLYPLYLHMKDKSFS